MQIIQYPSQYVPQTTKELRNVRRWLNCMFKCSSVCSFMVYTSEGPFLHGENKNGTKKMCVHTYTIYNHVSHMRANSIRTRTIRNKDFTEGNKILSRKPQHKRDAAKTSANHCEDRIDTPPNQQNITNKNWKTQPAHYMSKTPPKHDRDTTKR